MRNNQRRSGQTGPQPSSPAPTAELAFVAPTEFVALPSRGEFYPEDHPLYKQETVEIKFMTAKDEDILTSEALLKKNLAIDRLLESLLVADCDAASLLVGDRNAIIIAARSSAYGSEYKVGLKCGDCGEENEFIFDLHTATLVDDCFDKEFLHEEGISFNKDTQTFDVTLPVSNVTVGLALIDGRQEKRFNDKDNGKNRVTSLLSAILVKVNDNTEFDYVRSFIDAMPAKDSKHLRRLYPKLTPTVKLLQNYSCVECYSSKDVEVPLSAEFFWPE